MAQMISKQHKVACQFGCCRKRDRQNALKGES